MSKRLFPILRSERLVGQADIEMGTIRSAQAHCPLWMSSCTGAGSALTSFTLTLYPKGFSITGGLSLISRMVTCRMWSFFRGGVPRSDATTCKEGDDWSQGQRVGEG